MIEIVRLYSKFFSLPAESVNYFWDECAADVYIGIGEPINGSDQKEAGGLQKANLLYARSADM